VSAPAAGATGYGIEELRGGRGPFVGSPAFDLEALGYLQAEYACTVPVRAFASGPDGLTVTEEDEARTRLLVHRPTDPAAFDGTVLVEWLNVSAGLDAAPVWLVAHREALRRGTAWIGVSAQPVGVHGGTSALDMGPMALQQVDPERYGGLRVPPDRFSYDLFTAVAAVARTGAGTILEGLPVEQVLAVGESQSAIRLTTYVNEIDPEAQAYDGYLVFARGGPAAPLDDDGDPRRLREGPPVLFRDDLRVPVLCVESETDLIALRYREARQDDGDHLVVWEMAGTSHADVYTFAVGFVDDGRQPVEVLAPLWRPTREIYGAQLDAPVNAGPQHYIVQAAVRALDGWVRRGARPPTARPLELDGDGFALDDQGNALGGVRTPHVDVPTGRHSGLGNGGAPVAFLAGTTHPFDRATLIDLYGTRAGFADRVEASTQQAVEAGFVLEDDAAEVVAVAAANIDL
jgi:hypothetical protein